MNTLKKPPPAPHHLGLSCASRRADQNFAFNVIDRHESGANMNASHITPELKIAPFLTMAFPG